MSGTDTAASGAAAPGIDASQIAEPKRRAAQRERQRVPRRGAGQPAEAVAAARAVDQRIVVDGHEHPQLRIDAAQQGAQVVVLAEEGVEAAVHRQLGAVGLFGPAAHPAAEVVLALDEVHGDAAFGEPGRRGQAGDPAADDDDARPRRQRSCIGQSRWRRVNVAVGGRVIAALPPGTNARRCVPSRARFRCARRRIRRRACGAGTVPPRRRPGRCATDAGTAWCRGYATSRTGMMMPQHTACQIHVAACESRTEYSCTASVPPGRSRSRKARS